MLWTNIANLFSKTDKHDTDIQEWSQSHTRTTNDILQELQEIRDEIADVRANRLLADQVRKIKKYVNKKCETVRSDMTYGSFNTENEIFGYINKMRAEMEERIAHLESDNERLTYQLDDLYKTYDKDYDTFIKRENDLMTKLDSAVQLAEAVNQRVKDCEMTFARRIQEQRNEIEQSQYTMAGDLREEYNRTITAEIEMEHKTQLNWLQNTHDELVDLVTRSNEYHSQRYFGLLEDVKKTQTTSQEMCQTLKKSIGMVDAELSETKEKMEFLTEEVAQANNDIYDAKESIADAKDDIYREMDRDYYDLKDYIKRKVHTLAKKQKQKQEQGQQTSSVNVSNDDDNDNVVNPKQKDNENDDNTASATSASSASSSSNLQSNDDEHVIIMDESMFQSDSDEE
jgi:chromosome segregation ATPase